MSSGHSEPTSDTSLSRIVFESLEFDDQFALLSEVPFTGVVYSKYHDGALEFEHIYRDGLPEGLQQDWYPNGQLLARWIAIRGRGSSEYWTWYPEGQLRSYRRYGTDGFPVEMGAWNESGDEIDPKSQADIDQTSVMGDLFARAEALKLAGRSGSLTLEDGSL